jgi:hypothetical protein
MEAVTLTKGPLRWAYGSKAIAIIGSSSAAALLGLSVLEPGLKPMNFPDAVVITALYFQPALLMLLPRRRASLDLAAGILAALLGLGLFVVPYALAVPGVALAGLCTIVSAIGAIVHNSVQPETHGDAPVSVLTVVTTVAAVTAAGISSHPSCRTSAMESVCVGAATSFLGAFAALVALWLSAAIVWLAARKPDAPDTPIE